MLKGWLQNSPAQGAGPIRLDHEEGVRIDPERLADLHIELGERGAEAVICQAMEEMAELLSGLLRLAAASDIGPMPRQAQAMIQVAQQVGMASLARVAADVAACAERRDGPALAATLARLVRIRDRSLMAVWELQESRG